MGMFLVCLPSKVNPIWNTEDEVSIGNTALLLALSIGVAACSGGEQPINTDYSNLRLAPSSEGGLQYATSDEHVLGAWRNGLRMSLVGAPEIDVIFGLTVPASGRPGDYSRTTVQVAGVDEADLVKYDGEHVDAMMRSRIWSSSPRST